MYLQKLQTMAYVSLGIPLLFFIYIYLESSVDRLDEIIQPSYHFALFAPLAVLSLVLLYWNHKKFKNDMQQILDVSGLREKLGAYQLASNRRFYVYGFCSLLICIGFYLTNYQPFAALFGIMLVLFSIHNPSTMRIVKDLQLKNKEKEIIINGLDIP